MEALLYLGIVIYVLILSSKMSNRWQAKPGSGDIAPMFIFMTGVPWIILIGWFIYIGKWNGVQFTVLLLVSTALSSWLSYHAGRYWFADPFLSAVIGGYVGFTAAGTIFGIMFLN